MKYNTPDDSNNKPSALFKEFSQKMNMEPFIRDLYEMISKEGKYLTIFEVMTVFGSFVRKHTTHDYCVSVAKDPEDQRGYKVEVMHNEMFQEFWNAYEEEMDRLDREES